jgi:HSP20 family protein
VRNKEVIDMAIQRWYPWNGSEGVGRYAGDMAWHPLMMVTRPWAWWRMPAEGVVLMPAVEVLEDEDKFVVRAELPGMKKEEIDVSLLESTLTIEGERKAESEVKDDGYNRRELSYGKFRRSMVLPETVRARKVEAKYEDGILEIALPKVAKARRKKVALRAKEAKPE